MLVHEVVEVERVVHHRPEKLAPIGMRQLGAEHPDALEHPIARRSHGRRGIESAEHRQVLEQVRRQEQQRLDVELDLFGLRLREPRQIEVAQRVPRHLQEAANA